MFIRAHIYIHMCVQKTKKSTLKHIYQIGQIISKEWQDKNLIHTFVHINTFISRLPEEETSVSQKPQK